MASYDRTFFDNVYNHAFPVLLRVVHRIVASREVAEEICHDAFVKLYERIDRFPDVDQATWWLLRVGKNLAFNYSKRQQRERSAYERSSSRGETVSDGADETVMRNEVAASVQTAIDELPKNLREVLVLSEYGDLSYREIAEILTISVGNVKVRAHRARARLQKVLEERGAI